MKQIIDNKGFTFLELMVSVCIISLVFVSLFRMQSGTTALASADKFDVLAPLLANELLTEIEQDLEDWSQTQGEFGNQFPGIAWACEIIDIPMEEIIESTSDSSEHHLKRIDIKIVNQSSNRSFDFSTWRLSIE